MEEIWRDMRDEPKICNRWNCWWYIQTLGLVTNPRSWEIYVCRQKLNKKRLHLVMLFYVFLLNWNMFLQIFHWLWWNQLTRPCLVLHVLVDGSPAQTVFCKENSLTWQKKSESPVGWYRCDQDELPVNWFTPRAWENLEEMSFEKRRRVSMA